jgi:hypothetical protein
MVAQVGYSVARRSRGRVALCPVCTIHVETRSTRFLVEPQNQGRRFGLKTTWTILSDLASKLVVRIFSGLASNRWLRFFGLGLKTGSSGEVIWTSKSPRRFLGLGLKIKQVSVCRLRHKIDGGGTARDMCRDLVACFT